MKLFLVLLLLSSCEDGFEYKNLFLNHKRVFVSSQSTTGDFGGLAAGDTFCQNLADTASLGGTWKAFLSTSTADAISRIADVGPWVLVTKKNLIAENLSSLVNLNLLHPINVTELGTTLNSVNVWTGSSQTGTWDSTVNCVDWTAMVGGRITWTSYFGNNASVDSNWINTNVVGLCNASYYLYCFEQ